MERYLGIDFSGDASQWAPGCGRRGGRRAVWIAEVLRGAIGELKLDKLRAVQDLSGSEHPFQRLVNLLATENFAAAGIDAPFSVPKACLPSGGWTELVRLIDSVACGNRPFPNGESLLAVTNTDGKQKLYRKTEAKWRKCGPRSSVWHRGRPGTPFTVACLKLIAASKCPVWPWSNSGSRLLVEAYPAAQLLHWQLHNKPRREVVSSLSGKIDLSGHSRTLENSADALDAVLCSFAAVAVAAGGQQPSDDQNAADEGCVAVAS
jgi:predicted nuclease with RNAse H fold